MFVGSHGSGIEGEREIWFCWDPKTLFAEYCLRRHARVLPSYIQIEFILTTVEQLLLLTI